MNEQAFIDSESDEQATQAIQLNHVLPPANPIISKHVQSINERVSIKIDSFSMPLETSNNSKYRNIQLEKQPTATIVQKDRQFKHSPKKNNQQVDHISLTDEYDASNLIYQRYNNEKYNKRGNSKYIASVFLSIEAGKTVKLPEFNGIIRDDQLQFNSNFESANLLAVYKKGQNNYDLLLQNDVNTTGFTQWYNFKVHNKRHNFIAQFNIVNFYKSQSLYGLGMKPCVCSQKSTKNSKIIWRRKGFNIYYQQNDLSYEDNANKCYKTLTFQYDFTVQNDKVQFAHSMPYTLQNLKILLQTAKANNKVTIKTIGTTSMGCPIPMVRIKSPQNVQNTQKKAIVILARQHPGETVGSFIAEQILLQLLKHSTEVDFLLWRFQVFIFPLVNIDGVSLGNYRSNFYGYDLNRCWQKTDPIKHPEVYAIKNQIKKIKKKQNIELILDLHGHSRKMGSFFYGNNIGTNPMLFPYIASKTNSNISFEDSKFSTEKNSKASTARVVLGNLIKQTGNVYTYEVSFFGNYKNDKSKTFSFNEQHYQQLGKALVLSMYRTYMEMYKEQKTLKQSVYLKTIKKEIQTIKETLPQIDQDSGSDSQAQDAMIRQVKQLQEYQQAKKLLVMPNDEDCEQPQDQAVLIKPKEQKQRKQPIQKRNDEIRHKISDLLDRGINSGEYLQVKSLVRPRLPSIETKNSIAPKQQDLQKQLNSLDQTSKFQNRKKSKNPHKLKVYGQTYELKSRMNKEQSQRKQEKNDYLERQINSLKKSIGMKKQLSKQYFKREEQGLSKSFNTIDVFQQNIKQNNLNHVPSEIRKMKFRNNSLQLRELTPLLSQQTIGQTVKVHKLNHSKIKEYNYNNSSFVLQNAGRGLKLPQI